ncbi:hypothetical protein MRX96_042930 [Rhipicephalus microplus]
MVQPCPLAHEKSFRPSSRVAGLPNIAGKLNEGEGDAPPPLPRRERPRTGRPMTIALLTKLFAAARADHAPVDRRATRFPSRHAQRMRTITHAHRFPPREEHAL